MNRLFEILVASRSSRLMLILGLTSIVAGLTTLVGSAEVNVLAALSSVLIVAGAFFAACAFTWSLHQRQRRFFLSSLARSQELLAVSEAAVAVRTDKLKEAVTSVESALSKAEHRLVQAEIRARKALEAQAALKSSAELLEKRIHALEADMIRSANAAERRNILRMLHVAEKVDDCSELFTTEELSLISDELTKGDPFLTYWVLDAYSAFDILPLTPRRRLAGFLRDRGYWEKSLRVLRSVADQTQSERDMSVLTSRESELSVFAGGYLPALPDKTEAYESIPGHILHVVGKALPKTQTGYTLRTHYTALAQRKAGLHVSIVSQIGENETPHEDRVDFVNDVVYYSLAGDSKINRPLEVWLDDNVRALSALVERIRPSLLHAHSDFFNAISAQAVARQFGIPVVYESRGFWEESWLSRTSSTFGITNWDSLGRRWGMPDAYAMRKSMESEARKQADGVLTLARVMRDRIISNESDAASVHVVPNAVQAESFPVVGRDADLAARLGVQEDTLVVGYISSVVEYEGIDVLIDAFHHLVENSTRRLSLLIVGDGAVLNDLKAQRDRLGTPGVIFTGRVAHEEILQYYGMIDIFVVPRRPAEVCQLVTPLKPFEAFSTGRAVVMSDVAALREIAEDSGAAELFEAGDPLALERVLRRLVDDERLRTEMSARGAEWVRSERTWDKNAQVYVDLYDSLGIRPFGADASLQKLEEKLDIATMSKWIDAQDGSAYVKWFDTETGADASDIKLSGWTLSGFPTVPLDLPIDWENVCATNRSWAFHLHTWEFMDPLVQAYAKTSSMEDLDWCVSRALDWVESYVEVDSASEGSMAWYDMSLGLRSPRLMGLIALAVKAQYPDETIRRLMGAAMRHQIEHLLDRSFNPRTNHGYYAAVGQTVLGRGLRPLPGMVELEQQGNERLAVMASTQFKDDGAHSEHSPDYHRMVLDSFNLGIEQGLIKDDAVVDRISKAAHALGWMIKPDGRLVQFGDTPERDMTSGRLPTTSDENTNFLMTRGAQGAPNGQTLAVFPDAGYAFVRCPQPQSTDDHKDASYLALSAAFHSRAHKHADDLNFVWSDRGEDILVDAGRFGYGDLLPADSPMRLQGYYYGAPERQYVESTVAHNTVAVDGENHERRTRKPYGSGLMDCLELSESYELNGQANHGFWNHRRRLSMQPGQWLVVEDLVTSADGCLHDFRSWFNLAGHLELSVTDEGLVRVVSDTWEEPLWITQLSGAVFIEPARGEMEPMRGWRSLKDRTLEPTWSLGYALHQEPAGTITTLFNFGAQALDKDPRI